MKEDKEDGEEGVRRGERSMRGEGRGDEGMEECILTYFQEFSPNPMKTQRTLPYLVHCKHCHEHVGVLELSGKKVEEEEKGGVRGVN